MSRSTGQVSVGLQQSKRGSNFEFELIRGDTCTLHHNQVIEPARPQRNNLIPTPTRQLLATRNEPLEMLIFYISPQNRSVPMPMSVCVPVSSISFEISEPQFISTTSIGLIYDENYLDFDIRKISLVLCPYLQILTTYPSTVIETSRYNDGSTQSISLA